MRLIFWYPYLSGNIVVAHVSSETGEDVYTFDHHILLTFVGLKTIFASSFRYYKCERAMCSKEPVSSYLSSRRVCAFFCMRFFSYFTRALSLLGSSNCQRSVAEHIAHFTYIHNLSILETLVHTISCIVRCFSRSWFQSCGLRTTGHAFMC
jgi:hypothetical protein